jgi:glutaminase
MTAVGIVALFVVTARVPVIAQQTADPQIAENGAFNQFRTLKEGMNADYIPALAKIDSSLFGIALVTVDGKVFTAGDVKTEVSIQSISKVLTMAQVIQDSGKWLYHTGLPAESGVGGGLIAVSPGKFGIAVVSPPLDDAGNSVRAQRAIRGSHGARLRRGAEIAAISNALGGNPLAPTAR